MDRFIYITWNVSISQKSLQVIWQFRALYSTRLLTALDTGTPCCTLESQEKMFPTRDKSLVWKTHTKLHKSERETWTGFGQRRGAHSTGYCSQGWSCQYHEKTSSLTSKLTGDLESKLSKEMQCLNLRLKKMLRLMSFGFPGGETGTFTNDWQRATWPCLSKFKFSWKIKTINKKF